MAMLLAGCLGRSTRPAPSPEPIGDLENGLLAAVAIASPQPGGFQQARLYLIDPARETVAVLSPERLEIVNSVSWSPSGDRIAFSGGGPRTDEEGTTLFVVDIHSSELKGLKPEILGGNYSIHYPVWSPDGDRIAFCGPCHEPGWIYIINADGSGVHRVTNGGPLSWSPDGQHLVFVRRRGMSLFGDIYVSDIWGSEIRQLTTDIDADRPIWSPDGQRIAFYGLNRDESNAGIYVMDSDGSNRVLVTTDAAVPPSWSPDGNQLLYAAPVDAEPRTSKLYLINPDGSGKKELDKLPDNFFYLYAVLQPMTLSEVQ